MDKPNIIFILTDQQRFDTCGCYGQKLNITPNLDNLAEKGVIFEYAFTNQPVCGPARSILQTGKYATETGCYRNGIALPTESKTIAHYLSENGYNLAYVGKWHLASTLWDSKEDIGLKKDYMKRAVPSELRGGYNDFWRAADLLEFTSHPFEGCIFDENMNKLEFAEYRVDVITNHAIDFLDLCSKKNPFFLYLSYLEPHQQNDLNRFVGPIGSRDKYRNFEVPGDLKGTDGDWNQNYPDYLGCCNSIDSNLNFTQNKFQ
ncbi:MAG: sulfatase-like hydrolase/transferase [Candidatus Lokiarchaeota archaeon]|nr:sulfatase-like hydrolase/transferase [Candidatus Lokiarchaeota archaeon]